MSSFKRTVKGSSSQSSAFIPSTGSIDPSFRSGFKPWVHNGLGIVSSGHKQFDEINGGGLVCGTIVCIELDSFTSYGETLVNYGLIEAISHQQPVLLINIDEVSVNRIISSLPLNRTVRGSDDDDNTNSERSYQREKVNDNSKQLKIAWQYGKYLSSNCAEDSIPRSSKGPLFCCSYDLSRRIQPWILSNCIVELCSLSDLCGSTVLADTMSSGISSQGHGQKNKNELLSSILTSIMKFIASSTESPSSSIVSRLFLPLDLVITYYLREVGNHDSNYVLRDIALFLINVKYIVRDARCSTIVTIRPSLVSPSLIAKIRLVADSVFTIESFAGRTHKIPYEFNELDGFLVVHKLQQYGIMAPYRPSGTRFGLKRNKNKLLLEPLHLPPEENRTFAGTGASSMNSEVAVEKHTQSVHHTSHVDTNVYSKAGNKVRDGSISSVGTSMEMMQVASVDTPITTQDDRNPYKVSLAEKLAAIKAARLSNKDNTPTARLNGNDYDKIPAKLSQSIAENNPMYDF